MAGSARKGYRKLVDFFISKGANYFTWGLYKSVKGGYQNLIDYFISKKANILNLRIFNKKRVRLE
jgi:hypothetical protein